MRYKTCASVAEKTPKRLKQTLTKALKKSDYAEIRFDFLNPNLVPDALQQIKKDLRKCVCTLRPVSEGGKFEGGEKNRISIIKLIAEYNPFLLDVELNTLSKNKNLRRYLKNTGTDILVSWHNFKQTPSNSALKKKLTQMKKISNNIKIVTMAKSINDATQVLSLYKNNNTKLIAFSMGNYGRISRILCLFLGSPYTYASLGKPIAPGQFSVDEVKSIFARRK
ncbi:MAG: type I 3-dehydroquinate dehydratase [Thaumarchaeota archaeon]|jgi:3-dehydroquinate dehydratase-1|nr:MAG: type I 3-dehydroquinate dehydratase [Nitrososphaerota archaeon]HIF53481.1 type I 3-dehydroquinate dehydratase [Candidatus Nitrosopelagicus sp.]HIO32721.1 type I 3-dehydroquinate dehydratase [Candidatus Nitrosopelagicus sp.]|tara:strand:- start:600 stop:1268 length:669 start_codon:yes stop_codon:yes gene_type:complete